MERLTFFNRLRESRLVGGEPLARLAGRFPPGVPAHAVAAALISDGTLTRYQAQRLWAGKGKGLVLGQYRVLDELGKGGFGRVYKAVHALMGRVVALKVIAPELVEDRRARDWFKREVLAVTHLCHPNIVMAYDAGEVDNVLFLAMELVDGPSLEALVRQQGPLPVGPACAMMRQAALALQYAADKGVVHRDVKPANLLVAPPADDPDGPAVIKVVDFGLARLHSSGAKAQTLMLQGDKGFVGTPDFVSPEQACDVHAVDTRSDLYSLGCSFYYALCGHRPFRGASILETVVKHLNEEALPLDAVRPEVSPRLAAVVGKLMAKDPGQRFQTPAELIEELAPLCAVSGPALRVTVATAGEAPPNPDGGNMPATRLVPDLAFWSEPEEEEAEDGDPLATPSCLSAGVARAEVALPGEAGPAAVVAPGSARAAPPAAAAAEDEDGPDDAGPPLDPALCEDWRQWAAVVEMVAGGGRPQDVGAPAYRELHGRLLASCRAALAGAGGRRREVLERLETLVEPWLAPHDLASMDREALASLALRCRQLDRAIGGAGPASALWRWVGLFGAVFVGLFLAGWLCQRQSWMVQARSWAAALGPLVQHHPVLATAVLLPLVVLAALYLLPRFLRS